MMAIALRHAFNVPGVVLKFQLQQRELQIFTTKFAGVAGESRINGRTAGRSIEVPVLVYGDQFTSQAKLADWFESLNAYQGLVATLDIVSNANRPALNNCAFDSAVMLSDPLMDEAGSLGGGAWANILFLFRQLS